MTKQTLLSIKIERVEGNFEDCFSATATTFEQAEKIIQLMSQSAPIKGYNKVDFFIKWKGGGRYSGRIDLQQHMTEIDNNLVNHIKNSMAYRVDQQNIPPQARITKAQYNDFIKNYLPVEEVTTN